MYNVESLAQLEAVGVALVELIEGFANGISFDDASAGFKVALQAQAVVDEIKADKAKAIAVIVGSGLKTFGAS